MPHFIVQIPFTISPDAGDDSLRETHATFTVEADDMDGACQAVVWQLAPTRARLNPVSRTWDKPSTG